VALDYNGPVFGRAPVSHGTGKGSASGCGYVPLVEIRRGELLESLHHGAIAVVDSEDRPIASAGDPATVIVLRSAAKPAQVLPVLESGAAERFGFREEEVAVMIGSHNGEEVHLRAVRSILGKIGLGEEALKCGPHAPFHHPSAMRLQEIGAAPSSLHNNCSGKHAGMLALAVHLGAPVASYLEEDHPVQVRIRAAVETLAGLGAGGAGTAIDGCSAPTFAVPLRAAALMYARLAELGDAAASVASLSSGIAAAARRAVAAMRNHPEMVAGSDRLCTVLMRIGRGGLIAKVGAEGVYGLGFRRDGRGIGVALKIADGEGQRARFGAALEALRQLDALSEDDAAELRSRFAGELRNHRGLRVGKIATVFVL
jgi:L-asparaginase II